MKAQLELAIDRPYARSASLALDRAVVAADAKKDRARRRSRAIFSRLIECLNRRDRARLELQHHAVEPARRQQLQARLGGFHAEQDEYETQLARLAEEIDA